MNGNKSSMFGFMVSTVTAVVFTHGHATSQVGRTDATFLHGATTVPAADLADASARFERLSSRRRARVLDAVRAAMLEVDAPYVRAVRDLVEESRASRSPRVTGLRSGRKLGAPETAADEARPLAARLPFPASVHYRFGFGTIEEVDTLDTNGRRLSRSRRAALLDDQILSSMLDGRLPDLDRALAALLARLDDARSIDREAAFLESWTNGPESFYDALDRTAGRMEGVFHYDAMLEEWVRFCVPRDHADRKRFRAGLDAQLAGFQDAFLTYRSYRSVREMLALALLLDPDDHLPAPLGRFERNGVAGAHSTRECVDVVLAAHGGDPLAVLASFRAHREDLPEQAWSGRHEAWRGVDRMFDAASAKAIADGYDTFAMARSVHRGRRQLRDHLADVARRALVLAINS